MSQISYKFCDNRKPDEHIRSSGSCYVFQHLVSPRIKAQNRLFSRCFSDMISEKSSVYAGLWLLVLLYLIPLYGVQYLLLSYIFISFNLQITLRICKQAEIIPQENKKQTYLRSIRKVGLSFLKFFTCDQMIDEYIIMLQHCNQKRLCIMLRCFWLQFKLYFKANFSFK